MALLQLAARLQARCVAHAKCLSPAGKQRRGYIPANAQSGYLSLMASSAQSERYLASFSCSNVTQGLATVEEAPPLKRAAVDAPTIPRKPRAQKYSHACNHLSLMEGIHVGDGIDHSCLRSTGILHVATFDPLSGRCTVVAHGLLLVDGI
jgi:hypothetical protein